MSAMTYSGGFFGDGAERKLSIGPLAAHVATEPERSGTPLFSRPGPEDLSEAIPVFFIGRNQDGFWVARDADGKSGGLFWRKEAAIRFAKNSTWPAVCATIFPIQRIELDLDNKGNPLLVPIATIRRLLTRRVQRLIAAARKAVRENARRRG